MASFALERFPITWNHVIDKELLKFKELEHVRNEKVEQLLEGHALMVWRGKSYGAKPTVLAPVAACVNAPGE